MKGKLRFAVLTLLVLVALMLFASVSSAFANPAANLDQIRNGAADKRVDPGEWVNGNLGAETAHYAEGYSVPYRAIFTDLTVGDVVYVTIGFDIMHGGKHALDYLTSYYRLDPHFAYYGHNAETVDPTTGTVFSGQVATPDSTFDIPAPDSTDSPVLGQPTTSFTKVKNAGLAEMMLWGGTFTGADAIAYVTQGDLNSTGDSQAQVAIRFTATDTTAVLAWGGHIASQADWGTGESASAISGSPYHMALVAWTIDGEVQGLGQQDRSLSASAVIAPPDVSVIKTDAGYDPIAQGSNLVYTITVANVGDGPASNVLVTDTLDPNVSYVSDDHGGTLTDNTPPAQDTVTWTIATLEPGASVVIHLTVKVSGTAPTALYPASIPPEGDADNGGSTMPLDKLFHDLINHVNVTAAGDTNAANNDWYEPTNVVIGPGGGNNLSVSKTANTTFKRTYDWSISKAVDKTEVTIAEGGSYTFHYTVKVDQTGVTDSDWAISGTITVSNPNPFAVAHVSVTDVAGATSCPVTGGAGVDPTDFSIPAGGSVTLNYSQPAMPNGNAGTNTATATCYDNRLPGPTATGTQGFSFTTPTTTVNKTIHVTDTYAGALGTVEGTDAAPWATAEFKYDRTESGVAGTCTKYDNTAKITETGQEASKSVKLCVAKDLTVSKTAAGTFDRAYKWSISKAVDKTDVKIAEGGSYTFNYTVDVAQTGISDSGWTLSGKITVSNPNDFEAITLTDVTDAVDNGGTGTVIGPTNVSIPAGGSKTFDYSVAYASAPSSYSGTNTATATWDKTAASTPSGSASGSQTFTLSQLGSTNKTIHVTDTYAGALGTVTATDAAPFATATFNYARTESGVAGTCTKYDNTAKITETGQEASQSVKLCVAKDLAVSKTAAGTFDRTYLWSISKAVDKTHVDGEAGGTAVFNYTVKVDQTGISDKGWTLSGKITVSNPNDFEDITLTGLADAVDNGGVATVDPGPYVVPKSGSISVNYSVAYASAPSSYSGTNTATATWDKTAASTPSGSATGSKAFTLAQVGSTNKTIHVTDTYAGALGTVTATDAAPFATATFTYARSIPVLEGCFTYDNTATITETGQNASQTVEVCGPVFKSETAWAANNGVPGQLKYNTSRKRASWATYVWYTQPGRTAPFTTNLYAAQTILAGTVAFSAPVGGKVTISVTLNSPWVFPETGTVLYVQGYASAPSGNPSPGQFASKAGATTPTTASVTVPFANYYGVKCTVGQWVLP